MSKTKQTDFDARMADESEDAVYLDKQLKRVLRFLDDYGADDELIEAVEYFLQENLQWIDKEQLPLG